MRKKIIVVLTVALFGMQACAPDRDKTESSVTTEVNKLPTAEERKAKLESQRVARVEKRLADQEARLKIGPTYTDKTGKLIYHKAEVDPAFVGGEKALAAYMHDNLKYPKEAEDQGLEGTVFVDFVVLANGHVSEVEVINEPGDDIDQRFINEAVRVISAMPIWTAGQQQGKTVDVKFSLPVTFQII